MSFCWTSEHSDSLIIDISNVSIYMTSMVCWLQIAKSRSSREQHLRMEAAQRGRTRPQFPKTTTKSYLGASQVPLRCAMPDIKHKETGIDQYVLSKTNVGRRYWNPSHQPFTSPSVTEAARPTPGRYRKRWRPGTSGANSVKLL